MAGSKNSDLEIDQDLKAQRRLWMVQRFGAVVILIFVLASALGFLGPGLFALTEAGSPESIQVQYQKRIHFRDPTELNIEVSPRLIQNGRTEISVSRDFTKKVEIKKVTPEPAHVEARGDRYYYVFNAESSSEPFLAVFQISPEDRGSLETEISSGTEPPVKISQFVFP
jgi:hypothetical protein